MANHRKSNLEKWQEIDFNIQILEKEIQEWKELKQYPEYLGKERFDKLRLALEKSHRGLSILNDINQLNRDYPNGKAIVI